MRVKKETTAPIPSAVTGGEQSSMHKYNLSITEKKAEGKSCEMGNLGVMKYLSWALASIGVVTPQLQICKIWQGLRPLYPAATGGGADA